jgi:putative hydrolase of the HAD superfamily
MKIRAVIFDIYQTLREVSLPPSDAEARWVALWLEAFGGPPRFDLRGVGAACDVIIGREHAAARAAGIAFPEVYWPDVVAEVLPELTRSAAMSPEAFILRLSGLTHTVKLNRGAAAVLRPLHERGVMLGLASNCQPHTLVELEAELAPVGLNIASFHPSLRFFSFEHGFSKPDPHVLRLLGARLRVFGVARAEALVVGDRLDRDIEPARAQGWQTWHLGPLGTSGGGDWRELGVFLAREALA